ncbi:PIN domain-containing protein [Acinetobacter beijerinckii]|uniref:PIN domain-containing protein n=1 Tax=Acinetobacter beijerinckii TaxID=262668 RepID=UPI00300B968B
MIHAALDTSGIGKNRSQNHASYKALQRLVKAHQLIIHAPYVVKREIETQELDYYLKEYKALKDSLRKFLKVPKSEDVHKLIISIQENIQSYEEIITIDAEKFSSSWLIGLDAKIQDIDQNQAIIALEAYFKGTPPLTSIKNRDDIPDSFICRGFEEIQKKHKFLTVIADDKKIIRNFEKLDGYKLFKSIDEFIADTETQEKLKGLNIIEKEITALSQFITKYESLTSILHNYLESHISDEIWNSTIHLNSYSGDEEATITTAYEGNSIEINLESPIHYGDNQIGYSFSLLVEAEVEYFITHHDAYSHLDEDILMHMTNWNDYVSKVSKVFELRVNGIISIQINTRQIDPSIIAKLDTDDLQDFLSNIYQESTLNIESIEEIYII